MTGEPIRVADLIAKYTIEELNESADNYFRLVDRPSLLKKPYADIGESAEVIQTFLHALRGLALPPGATVLDFGAGSCWTSRIMAEFGYHVIASDVSPTALEIGRELIDSQLIGRAGSVRFLQFDGRKIDLPDASVDAVLCISAFHHTPNPDTVIQEFGRVLKPWGVAGLSEPGPAHSLSEQSQLEMRSFTVIENDVDIDRIWSVAQSAGFTNIELDIFYPDPVVATLGEFKAFLAGDRPNNYESRMRALMSERRLFWLEKGVAGVTTSAEATGLDGRILPATATLKARPGETVPLKVSVTNTGSALWRGSHWYSGPVRLGPSIEGPDLPKTYLGRWLLPSLPRQGLLPAQTAEISGEVLAPTAPGTYRLNLQMVAEHVAWFGPERHVELIVAG